MHTAANSSVSFCPEPTATAAREFRDNVIAANNAYRVEKRTWERHLDGEIL